MSEAKYVRRSLQALSDELADRGHEACPTTVADLLHDLDYHLYVNVKRFTGPPHPDRDRQFCYIERLVGELGAAGLPILSVDAKKKELIGNFANGGRAWGQEGEQVNAHDFLTDTLCRAAPWACTTYWQTRAMSWSARRRTRRCSRWRRWRAGGCGAVATARRGQASCCCWRTRAAATASGRGCGRKPCRNW